MTLETASIFPFTWVSNSEDKGRKTEYEKLTSGFLTYAFSCTCDYGSLAFEINVGRWGGDRRLNETHGGKWRMQINR
jgi:hypothetical protein